MTETTTGVSAFLDARPRIRPDLLFSRELHRGPARVYLVKISGGRAFEVAAKEQFLMCRLDGQRTLSEIGDEYASRFGRRLGSQQWGEMLGLLHQRGLLEQDDTPAPGALHPPPPFVRRLAAAFGWAFTAPAGFAAIIILIAMYAYLAAFWAPLWRAAEPDLRDWRSLLGIVAIAYVSAALHELAHGVAAIHFGCRTIRISLIRLSCRVDDYLYLPVRSQQVAVASVGGVVNSVIVAPFALIWMVTPLSVPLHRFAAAVVVVCGIQSLINYVPTWPLDGYRVLSHLLDTINLAEESHRYVWSRPRAWRSGQPLAYPARARRVLGAYGVTWLVAALAACVAFQYVGTRLLRPALGHVAGAVTAIILVLTISGWLTGRYRKATRARTNNING